MNHKTTLSTLTLISTLATLLLLLSTNTPHAALNLPFGLSTLGLSSGRRLRTKPITNPQSLISPSPILINELDAQTPGADEAEFVELYDGGGGNTPLDGLVLVLFNGSSESNPSYRAIDLSGHTTDADGYFLIGNAAIPGVDLTFGNSTLQNGPDAAAIYSATVDDFPNGTPVTTTHLIDAIVYDDYNEDDSELRAVLLNPGQPIALEGATSTEANVYSTQRCPNGSGGARNTQTCAAYAPTPGAANQCTARPIVLDVFPNHGDDDISVDTTVRATFNTTMTNVNPTTFLLQGPAGLVPGSVSYSTGSQRATLTPLESLAYNALYTATLKAELMGPGSALLGQDYIWSFTTEGNFIYLPIVLRDQ